MDAWKGQTDNQLADHERRLQRLEAMDLSASPTTVTGEVDTAAILKQLNLVKTEVNQVRVEQKAFVEKTKADLEALRLSCNGYTDNEVRVAEEKLTKRLNDSMDTLKYELDRLRAEFENFKNKDFRDLEARVSALEKRFKALSDAFANMKVPEAVGGGVSQEAFNQLVQRVNDLEDALNHLRNEFVKWMKELQDSLNQKADFAQMDKAL